MVTIRQSKTHAISLQTWLRRGPLLTSNPDTAIEMLQLFAEMLQTALRPPFAIRPLRFLLDGAWRASRACVSIPSLEAPLALYLITGIAGFIGSALARQLLAQGHAVRGIDNLSNGTLDNLEGCLDDIDFSSDDIRNASAMRRACHGVDYVLHQAAMASVPRSIESPEETHDSNVNGTLQVLLAARDAGVHRVVYAASSSAYGDQPDLLKHEGMCPRPLSPYAVQKLAGEHYMQAFHTVYGLETVCLRYFNIFGPRQAADSPYSGVIAKFATVMLTGQTPTIFGDGLQSRDFTYVANAVQANLLAARAPGENVAGRVFNIGTGEAQTLRHLHASLAKILDLRDKPSYQPTRVGDVRHSLADITQAQSLLGYKPLVNFQEGLRETVRWYLDQRNPIPREEVTFVLGAAMPQADSLSGLISSGNK